MTESTVFIPSKINVGYQKRQDTYNGNLAYVIYYDQKGKLRKEASWNTWRDKNIPNNEYSNEPTEGFVLNKKVGGYGGWNPRQTYSRIYDPRGFEFEITVPNLLYILENANCMKGKGLEGKFVYAWDGTELLLIPEAAPEYAKHIEFSNMLTNKESIKGADLVLGGVYRSNQNEDLVYLGRFDYWDYSYSRYYTSKNKGKHYFFTPLKHEKYHPEYYFLKSLSNRIVKTVSKTPVPNYAELMDKLEHKNFYSPYDESRVEFKPVKTENLHENIEAVFIENGKYTTRFNRQYHFEHNTRIDDGYVLFDIRRTKELPPEQYKVIDSHDYYRMTYNNTTHYNYTLGSYMLDEELDSYIKSLGDKAYQNDSKKGYSFAELNQIFKFQTRKRILSNGKEER